MQSFKKANGIVGIVLACAPVTHRTRLARKKKPLMCPFHVALPHLHCKAPRAHSHRITEDAASSLLTCSHGPHTPEPSWSGAGRRRRSRSSGEARLFKQGLIYIYYNIVLYQIILCYIILCYIMLHHIMLYYIMLYFIRSYHIIQ